MPVLLGSTALAAAAGAGFFFMSNANTEAPVTSGAGDKVRFVRVGTLDNPDALPPDIHIYTVSKQPWVVIPKGARAVPEYYDPREVWSADSRARWKALKG